MAAPNAGAPPPTPPPAEPSASERIEQAFRELKIPPTGVRVAIGVLVFIGIYIAIVGIPTYVIQLLQGHNVPLNLNTTTMMYVGGAVAVLGGAQYALKPNRAYGPVSIGVGLAEVLYLIYFLYPASPLSASFGGSTGATIQVGIIAFILFLILLAVIAMAGDAVTTWEDLHHPAERLYWTYKPRQRPVA